jgi:hypothetical protein
MVKMAGNANTKLTAPKPREANKACDAVYPDCKKIVEE